MMSQRPLSSKRSLHCEGNKRNPCRASLGCPRIPRRNEHVLRNREGSVPGAYVDQTAAAATASDPTAAVAAAASDPIAAVAAVKANRSTPVR